MELKIEKTRLLINVLTFSVLCFSITYAAAYVNWASSQPYENWIISALLTGGVLLCGVVNPYARYRSDAYPNSEPPENTGYRFMFGVGICIFVIGFVMLGIERFGIPSLVNTILLAIAFILYIVLMPLCTYLIRVHVGNYSVGKAYRLAVSQEKTE